MSYSHSIPPTVQIRRDHLLGLIGAVAALAACVTWVVTAFAFDSTSGAVSSSHATATRVAAAQQAPATFTMTRKQIVGLSTMGQQTRRHSDPLVSMTPAQLAGVGLGTGYQLPNAQSSPTSAAVLASMSPETRRYTESVMNLTFEQLAAGAAGHP
jgi:beta-lactamase regulating signal transducer with metallopeptidase domain